MFVRFAVFGLFGALVLLGHAPRPLALLGFIDLVAALWTATALKSEHASR